MNTRQLRVIGLLGLVLAISLGFYTPLRAATASSFAVVNLNEDAFMNYDFLSGNPAPNNVDWTIDMIFWNNASVSRVKEIYWRSALGNSMWFLGTDDGYNWFYSTDSGTRDGICNDTHMRLYGPNNNRFYTTAWGYYVIATSHLDVNECIPWDQKFGWSENAEGILAAFARDQRQLPVIEDWLWFGNPEPYHPEGNHYWHNDGWASAVYVP